MITSLIEDVQTYDSFFVQPDETIVAKEKVVDCRLTGNLIVIRNRWREVTVFGGSSRARSDVCKFSESSGRRLGSYLRECVPEYRSFITLTYPPGYGQDGVEAKRDLSAMCKRIRRHCARQSFDQFSLLWFMEFTGNGVIHFHMLCTHYVSKGFIAGSWYEIVGSFNEYHLRAGTRIEKIKQGRAGIASYVRKYAAKQCQKVVPEGFGWIGRFWGVCGSRERRYASITLTVKMANDEKFARKMALFEDKVLLAAECTENKVLCSSESGAIVIALINKSSYEAVRDQLGRLVFCSRAWFESDTYVKYPELAFDISDDR
jgi:hypothetical protein